MIIYRRATKVAENVDRAAGKASIYNQMRSIIHDIVPRSIVQCSRTYRSMHIASLSFIASPLAGFFATSMGMFHWRFWLPRTLFMHVKMLPCNTRFKKTEDKSRQPR